MERILLNADEIRAGLEGLNGWEAAGSDLHRRFEFENFAAALDFVNRVGAIADELDHHPDITFGWGYADITTTTHDRGGITPYDLTLAKRINEL